MNKRIETIAPSVSLTITAKAKALAAAGKTIYSFAAGEPDFDTPEPIKAAAIKALSEGQTKYAPVAGLPRLRELIAAKLRNDNGLAYEDNQISVANGAKQSVFNACMALCSEGSEVLIPAPYWLSYPEMVAIAGGVPVIVPCRESDGYKLSPEALAAAITDKSVALILNSPSNPIGVVYTPDELKALASVAIEKGLTIISDEIYEKMVYDGVKHASVASFGPEFMANTITINGFSKAYAMTGWRLGYMAGPSAIIKAINAFQSHSTSGANTFAQYGAIAALEEGEPFVQEMVAAFDERRSVLYGLLNEIDGISCVKPQGAFYVLPNISSCGLDSVTFAERLLDEAGVAVVPGKAFGVDETVRLSYACSMDNIREGVARFRTFFESL